MERHIKTCGEDAIKKYNQALEATEFTWPTIQQAAWTTRGTIPPVIQKPYLPNIAGALLQEDIKQSHVVT